MKSRERSIRKLKRAVKNKTLGCYNEKVLEEQRCVYYHGESNTCCAVGALIPKKTLMNNLTINGNCIKPFNKNDNDMIHCQIYKGRYGMSLAELKDLQQLHDNAILAESQDERRLNTERLENYINSLQV